MSGSNNIDELKRKFIVDEGTYEAERLKDDLEQLTQYCKITGQGKVLITAKDLADKKKVGLVIIARYIGNKLVNNIPEIVNADEIASYTGIEKAVVNARGKDLVDEGFASKPETGKYKANPGQISDFLEGLKARK